ncbi:uncharacterized protein LOC114127714 isoform X2 [Aphis gossypii]|uniref:uncharacterized protein LOC114127714 isoform X2 n=1 Tax=Aphis gossypii TaxID=80765 RepID=UPI002159A6CE|nr:uncharacterized protein LOC114127714 isoform X2 [Aphis gossypii]
MINKYTCRTENKNTLKKKEKNDLHKDKTQKTQPRTCQELWKSGVLCSSINPLERIKCFESGCCLMSPIPTTDDYKSKLLFEPLFSRRTSFAIYKEVFKDQRCTCVKFNGIENECKHPECKQNLKCLTLPLATCSPAENWNKYFGQTS